MRHAPILLAASLLAASCGSTPTRFSMSLFEAGASAEGLVVDGPRHECLTTLVGEWATTSTYWNKPARNSGQESHGSCTYGWNEQGNLLIGRHTGELMGCVFTGASVLGYDALAGGFVSSWADSDGELARPLQVASCQDDSGNFELERATDGGVTREVLSREGPDRHVYEMYRSSDAGPEWCMLRVVYTR
jgi:hypothetical protein